MAASAPLIVLIGGPNGAGKSTTAPLLLKDALHVDEFVNADVIAQGISAFHPERAALQAGRTMLRRIKELASQRADFAFESTLASRSFAPWIAGMRSHGYEFALLFLSLPNASHAIARVAERVKLGGHHVPAEIVERRYIAGLRNFFDLYRPLADIWRFYDNSGHSSPRLLAAGQGTIEETVHDASTWLDLRNVARK